MDNYSDFFIDFAKNCSKTQKKSFKKSEIITTYIAKRNQFCLLLSGEANLIRYDFNGNRTIVEHFSTGAIFGEIFYTVNTNNELFVEAKKNSTVMFFSYDNVENKCDTNCTFHNKLIQTLPSLFLNQIIELNMRIELLSKRTIREKLLAYFDIMSKKRLSKTFTIPLTYTDLADYLGIDRSAMQRELKNLKEDNLIKTNNKKITLNY